MADAEKAVAKLNGVKTGLSWMCRKPFWEDLWPCGGRGLGRGCFGVQLLAALGARCLLLQIRVPR